VPPLEVAKYFVQELKQRVCAIAGGVETEMSFSDYKDLFSAGCDICGTGTFHGTALSQRESKSEDAVYELNKAAARNAKMAAAEATAQERSKPRFVAGVIGPTIHSLSTSPDVEDTSFRSVTWTELVAAYIVQIRGLSDGGVDLLAIEAVTDTLNAKAAIYAVDEYYESTGKERPPLLISVVVNDGRTCSGQSLEAFAVSVGHGKPLALGISGKSLPSAYADLASACRCYTYATGDGAEALKGLNFVGGATASQVKSAVAKAVSTRALPALPASPPMRLAGLEAFAVASDDGLTVIGQKCNMQGSKKFKDLIHAYKYTTRGNSWKGAMEMCMKQYESGADLLDVNFDSDLVDPKWAMGKFMRLCATTAVAKAPFILGSKSWPVIQEGLRNVQGKCIVNALSLLQGEEELVRAARGCQRHGAAVIIVAMETADEPVGCAEKVAICRKAYELLRSRLDFPAEDIIFDCGIAPLGSEDGSGCEAMSFIEACSEVRTVCPGVSLIGGVSNLSLHFRGAPRLREALHRVFLERAVPRGMNMAIVDPDRMPPYADIKNLFRELCEEAILATSADGSHLERLSAFADRMSGEVETFAHGVETEAKEVPMRLVNRGGVPVKQTITHVVQATGTLNGSVFMMFGSKAHGAAQFHRSMMCNNWQQNGHFSSISAYMGQSGGGTAPGMSGMLDSHALMQKMLRLGVESWTCQWGAIGEIGLRRTVYGSRDVFALFELGQKLLGPKDTHFLMRALCAGKDRPEFTAMAYLDDTWKATLNGSLAGAWSTNQDRKTFADM